MFSGSGAGTTFVNNVELGCSAGLILYPNFEYPPFNIDCLLRTAISFDGTVWVSASRSPSESGIWAISAACANGVQGMVGSQAAMCRGDGCSFYQDVQNVPTSGTCTLTFGALADGPMTLAVSFGCAVVLTVAPAVETPLKMRRYFTSFTLSSSLCNGMSVGRVVLYFFFANHWFH
jgi:hypothetical protein